jgi:methyl-accepting chemotaxis protein
MEQRIASGELSSPQAGNAALTPLKDAIRTLTDESVVVAEERAQAAEDAGVRLEAMIRRTITIGLALGGLALTIATGWVLWFPNHLLRPVAALHGAVRRMAAGDLAARTGLARRDELGDLAQGFDAMATQIAARTEELARQHAQAETARQVADAARRQANEQLATMRRDPRDERPAAAAERSGIGHAAGRRP